MDAGDLKTLADRLQPPRTHDLDEATLPADLLEEARASGDEDSAKTRALVGLHVRGARVAKQVRALLLAGFAGGALSRWRTLYEVTVVADFLAEHDDELSERYLNHSVYMARKDMRQYERYQEALGSEPVTDSEWDRMDTRA